MTVSTKALSSTTFFTALIIRNVFLSSKSVYWNDFWGRLE